MPDPDSKDHYTAQEILERLRGEGGEHKPRKRRSTQPHVLERKKRRLWLVLLAVALLLLCFTWIVLQMMNQSRVEGEIFRSTANRHLSGLAGCQVECDRFRSPGWHATDCSTVRLTGTSSVFKDLLLTNLTSAMSASSFFRNEWDIMRLDVDVASLTFQSHSGPKRIDDDPNVDLAVPINDDGFRLGLSATPAYVSVHDLRISKLDLSWPAALGQTNRIDGLLASGSLNNGELRIDAADGIWHGGLWPDLTVERLTVTYGPSGANLENARIRLTEKAQIRASGKIEFTPLGPAGTLDLKFDPLSIADILPPVWSQRLHGKVTISPAIYNIKPGKLDELSGTLTMDGAIIDNFPGFPALAHFFGTELYSNLQFRQLTAHFRHTAETTVIEDLNGYRAGECRLTGKATLHRDGALEGTFRLLLNTIEKDLPQFTEEVDGLDAIDFTIGGTATEPTDTLTEQFPGTAPIHEFPSLLKDTPGK